MNSPNDTQSSQVRRWRELLASERDAAALYSRLAAAVTYGVGHLIGAHVS